MCEHNNSSTLVTIPSKRWSRPDSIRTLGRFVCSGNTTNRLDKFCLVTSAKISLANTDDIVSYRYVLLSLHSDSWFLVHLCDLFTPDFVNLAIFSRENLSICPNADEAFYLPAASAEAAAHFVVLLVVAMMLSDNAKRDQRARSGDVSM